MKNAVSCIELPRGDIKTVENILSFESDDGKVILSSCKEERNYNGFTIVEKHRCRVSRKKNRIRIIEITSVTENGFEKKIIECVEVKRCDGETMVKRHRRATSQKKTIDDVVFCSRQDNECFENLRAKALELFEITANRIHTI